MSEIDRDDTTDPAFASMNIDWPPAGIDIRRILMALKDEMLIRKLNFSYKFEYHHHVVIPTLREKFSIEYKNGYLLLKAFKKYRIPVEYEDERISDNTIDILCAVIEKLKLNYPFKSF